MNCEPSQAAIARALGLAKSRITAMKKEGMPVHSIEAAQAWRVDCLDIARRKPAPSRPAPARQNTAHLAIANALLEQASVVLDAGQSIDALVPVLSAAMADVPIYERGSVVQPDQVIRRMIDVILGVTPEDEAEAAAFQPDDDDGQPFVMDEWAKKIRYHMAAGEVRLD